MNYPVWELEIGAPLLIAVVAIIHVFISHFAIGGGLFLVVSEHLAYRKNDKHFLNYLKTHSKFFALVTLVAGALTGVGIWFTIGLVSPAATSSLIRIFVWGWAIEWVFFLVEIAAAIFYYSSWDTISRSKHLAIGWIYFASSFLSLVVINGIITFMLTPGAWLETGRFQDGFFNPTYWPSLITRTAICGALAGIYAFLTGHFVKIQSSRAMIIRYAGIWALCGTVLAIPSMWWYFTKLPAGSAELLSGGLPAAGIAAKLLVWGGIALTLLLLIPIFVPRKFRLGSAVITAALAITVLGASEWVRETIRKPYVIYDFIYGNSLHPADYETIEEKGGVLAYAVWVSNRDVQNDSVTGRDVFRLTCRGCHTISGYNGLGEALSGLDREYISEMSSRLEYIRGNMPSFPGNLIESQAVGTYIHSRTDQILFESGEQAFDKRCGLCHSVDGEFRPLFDFMDGMSELDIADLIPLIADLTEAMPPWTGSDDEVILISEYIYSWSQNDSDDPEEDN